MNAKDRYKLYDEAVAVLEEEATIIRNTLDRMEKALANQDLQLISGGISTRGLRNELSKVLSKITKGKYAKVQFR